MSSKTNPAAQYIPVTKAEELAGIIYPLRVSRVRATGTTATGIVGLR